MGKRAPLSKKLRFEVFKRDGFKCQYCGRTPPKVMLQVDHVHPVSKGGTNDMNNLVTCCFDCNAGKRNILLDQVPESLAEKARAIKEREEQLVGYGEVMQASRERLEREAWEIAEVLQPGASQGFDRKKFASIKMFIERQGYWETLDAAEIAESKPPGKQRFLYFCGVCWTKIRQDEGLV